MEDNARTSGLPELPMYHGAPRDNFRGVFHVEDVPDDLWDGAHAQLRRHPRAAVAALRRLAAGHRTSLTPPA
nr:hypothetical protein GCM10010200_112060 [Actinomadura rugatobispora]